MQRKYNDLVIKFNRYKEMGINVSGVNLDDYDEALRQLRILKVIFGEDHPEMKRLKRDAIENQKTINEYAKSGYDVSGTSKYMKKAELLILLKSKI